MPGTGKNLGGNTVREAPEHGAIAVQEIDGGDFPFSPFTGDSGRNVPAFIHQIGKREPESPLNLMVQGQRGSMLQIKHESGDVHLAEMGGLVVETAQVFRPGQIKAGLLPCFPDGRLPGTFIACIDLSSGKADVAGPGIAVALRAEQEEHFQFPGRLAEQDRDGRRERAVGGVHQPAGPVTQRFKKCCSRYQ